MTTLSELRRRVSQTLSDTVNRRYSTALVEQAIRCALEEYSQTLPQRLYTVLTLPADSRRVDLSALDTSGSAGALDFEISGVYYPYTPADVRGIGSAAALEAAATPLYGYTLEGGSSGSPTLVVNEGDEPAAGTEMLLSYRKPHTIDGLDGAVDTTVPAPHIANLSCGAAGHAALMRSAELVETYNSPDTEEHYLVRWGNLMLSMFRRTLQSLAKQNQTQTQTQTAPYLSHYSGSRWPLDGWDAGKES